MESNVKKKRYSKKLHSKKRYSMKQNIKNRSKRKSIKKKYSRKLNKKKSNKKRRNSKKVMVGGGCEGTEEYSAMKDEYIVMKGEYLEMKGKLDKAGSWGNDLLNKIKEYEDSIGGYVAYQEASDYKIEELTNIWTNLVSESKQINKENDEMSKAMRVMEDKLAAATSSDKVDTEEPDGMRQDQSNGGETTDATIKQLEVNLLASKEALKMLQNGKNDEYNTRIQAQNNVREMRLILAKNKENLEAKQVELNTCNGVMEKHNQENTTDKEMINKLNKELLRSNSNVQNAGFDEFKDDILQIIKGKSILGDIKGQSILEDEIKEAEEVEEAQKVHKLKETGTTNDNFTRWDELSKKFVDGVSKVEDKIKEVEVEIKERN